VIREVARADAAAIAAIYNEYVARSTVTFEEAPVEAAAMESRIASLAGRLPWLVACEGGEVLAYAYAAPWRARSAYRFSVESSIYVAREAVGKGIGTALYTRLLGVLRERGCHAVIGGITLPNTASVALHEKLGFEPVGVFREVGWKFGGWRDVGYWQLHFDGVPHGGGTVER
jgi:phosphinothricin acetyltransferase